MDFIPVESIGVVVTGQDRGFTRTLAEARSAVANTAASVTGNIQRMQASINAASNTALGQGFAGSVKMAGGLNVLSNQASKTTLTLSSLQQITSGLWNANGAQAANGLSLALGMAGKLGWALAGIAGAGWATKLAADAEMMQTQFKVLLGSAEQAKSLTNEIYALADVTPLESGALMDSAKALMAADVAAGDIVSKLRMLGDLSMGNQVKLDYLSKAYTDVKNKGKLQGQELRQFAENGIGLMKVLEGQTGKTRDQLISMMEKGAISFEMVDNALKSMVAEGGRFHNFMGEGAATAVGRTSTLRDTINAIGRDLGKVLLPLYKLLLVAINATLYPIKRFAELMGWIVDKATEFYNSFGKGKVSAEDMAKAAKEAKAAQEAQADAAKDAADAEERNAAEAEAAKEALKEAAEAAKEAREAVDSISLKVLQDQSKAVASEIRNLRIAIGGDAAKQQMFDEDTGAAVGAAQAELDAKAAILARERNIRAQHVRDVVDINSEAARALFAKDDERIEAASAELRIAQERMNNVRREVAAMQEQLATRNTMQQQAAAMKAMEEAAEEAAKRREDIMKRAAALGKEYATPFEKFNETQRELETILNTVGNSFLPTYQRAIKAARDELERTIRPRVDLQEMDSLVAGTAKAADAIANLRLGRSQGVRTALRGESGGRASPLEAAGMAVQTAQGPEAVGVMQEIRDDLRQARVLRIRRR